MHPFNPSSLCLLKHIAGVEQNPYTSKFISFQVTTKTASLLNR